VHHLQDARLGIDVQGDHLPHQGLREVVASIIDIHTPVGTHFAMQHLSMVSQEPSVRVNPLWQRGQGRQERKSDPWRLIVTAASLMWALFVVMLLINLSDRLNFLQGRGPMHQQALVFVTPMIALDVGIFLGLMNRADIGSDPQTEQKTTSC